MRFFNGLTDPFERVALADQRRDTLRPLTVPPQDLITSRYNIPLNGEVQLDSIAVQVYGEGSEYAWYLIGNRNIREIIGWKGDFTYIRSVDVPPQDSYL